STWRNMLILKAPSRRAKAGVITFCSTERSEKISGVWKTRATPSWLISWGFLPVRMVPSKMTAPLVGGRRPMITLSRVDLPAPFGPMMACVLPSSTCRSMSARACRPPKCLCTSATWRTMFFSNWLIGLLRRLRHVRQGLWRVGLGRVGLAGAAEQRADAADALHDAAGQEHHDQDEDQAQREVPAFADELGGDGADRISDLGRQEREEAVH